ncbi:hypothetical protein Ga0100231_021480 [Opitutaceae bacterium TAV4]|nr:hypothetical protein Ga0100231_021480 [Opitutaceae bacterium TAV4]RRJ99776.1 hypothetical protein Ga0100230_017100 [Opitutaceae bacterium TAV3]
MKITSRLLTVLSCFCAAALSLANAAGAQTVIADYATGFSTTQGQNGWSYRYTTSGGRYTNPLSASEMTLGNNKWFVGSAGGDRAEITATSMFQRAANDPLLVYTFSASYEAVTIDLNGLTVNANGQGYVGYWNSVTSTWTTLLTLNGGTTYSEANPNNTITLTGISSGDSIVFGKVAGYGANYGAITSLAPIIRTAEVPEPKTSAAIVGLAALVAVGLACRRGFSE